MTAAVTNDRVVPAGWYADPSGSPAVRWWDGTQWTDHVAHPSAPQHDPASSAMKWMLPLGRSGWAIAAGYAGLFAILILPAPLALVLGLVAMFDIRRNRRGGTGRAVFGIVMGALGSALLAFILFFS